MSSTSSSSSVKISTTYGKSGNDGLFILAFYVILAIVYMARWPKWIAYVLLTLSILWLLYMIMILAIFDKVLKNAKLNVSQNRTLPIQEQRKVCQGARQAELCGVWVSPTCYLGFLDGETNTCQRAGIPTSVYVILVGLILFHMLLLKVFMNRKDAKKS